MKIIKDKLYFFIGIVDILSALFALETITTGDLLAIKPFAYIIMIGGIALVIMSLFKKDKKK